MWSSDVHRMSDWMSNGGGLPDSGRLILEDCVTIGVSNEARKDAHLRESTEGVRATPHGKEIPPEAKTVRRTHRYMGAGRREAFLRESDASALREVYPRLSSSGPKRIHTGVPF